MCCHCVAASKLCSLCCGREPRSAAPLSPLCSALFRSAQLFSQSEGVHVLDPGGLVFPLRDAILKSTLESHLHCLHHLNQLSNAPESRNSSSIHCRSALTGLMPLMAKLSCTWEKASDGMRKNALEAGEATQRLKKLRALIHISSST